ncbi:MAG TPA: hypothetical protein VFZ10_17665 [Geminicoccaceae bacterium]
MGESSVAGFAGKQSPQLCAGGLAAWSVRLRTVLRPAATMLLVAVAIVGSWTLVAFILWLAPRIVHAVI